MQPNHRMLRTFLGSPDGLRTRAYNAGKVEYLPPELARQAVSQGWAEALLRGEPVETKVVLPAEIKTAIDLEAMPLPDLRRLAAEQYKIAVHRNWGRPHIIKAIRKAAEAV